MSLIPLRDVVVIEIDKTDETPGGIQLLDSHKDPAGTDTGKVVHIRQSYYIPGNLNIVCTDVVPGAKVLFMRKHGIAVKGNKRLVCCRYENLLAVIEE
jgi:co-chaperonin GroES (HSP10)